MDLDRLSLSQVQTAARAVGLEIDLAEADCYRELGRLPQRTDLAVLRARDRFAAAERDPSKLDPRDRNSWPTLITEHDARNHFSRLGLTLTSDEAKALETLGSITKADEDSIRAKRTREKKQPEIDQKFKDVHVASMATLGLKSTFAPEESVGQAANLSALMKGTIKGRML